MTNHWVDMRNTDVALIIGANPAENHPVGFNWILEARERRGAKIISVDPRFTRTSALADLYAPLRPGTDIAFIGGLINLALETGRFHREYVVNYTNASYLVDESFGFREGLFTGYDPEKRRYDKSTWKYQTDTEGKILQDPTLQHPRTVFQLMKAHYSRYDPDTVARVTGMPRERFLQIADLFLSTAAPDKTGTILYAMGGTQHTVGSQNVRAYAILQMLLGNIGRPGGGVNALRGLSNVQGSTDVSLLFNNLPGYLPTPDEAAHPNLAAYNASTPKAGYWTNRPKFLVSLLKAYWGDKATPENDFAYDYLPKLRAGKNYSHIALFEDMYAGKIRGLFNFGQNPVCSGPNAGKEARALEKLDWLVTVDIFENETAGFWKRPGVDPKTIQTEVFLLPAAHFLEKAGSVTNSGRLLQWRWQATAPPGDARSDLWIVHNLALRLKAAYASSTRPEDAPIRDLHWDYGPADAPDVEKVAAELNGYRTGDRTQLDSFAALADDGSTAAGCWIYTGYYGTKGNRAASRKLEDPGELGNYPGWGFAWPANRRVLYNRASADPEGQPWAPDKAVIWWDGGKKQWVGYDVPDFPPTRSPEDPGGRSPFIMLPEGVGLLFASGMVDGPFPEHYEPFESPVENALNPVPLNPAVRVWTGEGNDRGDPERFPIVASTWRLTEHQHSGAVTRRQTRLVEMVPEPFVEMSPSLAEARGIRPGDWVVVRTARGQIRARALVTPRVQPLQLGGKQVQQIGIPWHWGFLGLVTGDIANVLTPHIGDANTMIPEYKVFLCDVQKAEGV